MTRILCGQGQGHHRHFDYFFILPQYKVQCRNFDIGQEVDIKFVWLYEDNFSKTLFWQIYQNYFFSEKFTPFHNTHYNVKMLAFDSNYTLRKMLVQNLKLFQNPAIHYLTSLWKLCRNSCKLVFCTLKTADMFRISI